MSQQYLIEILDGDRAGETVPLREGTLRIGRKASNELVLKDEKASGVHAEIVFEDGRFVLRDLDSTNGTLMEGHRVQEIALTAGDTFQIGKTHLRFAVEGESPADLEVHRLDRSRLARTGRSRSVLMLGLAIAAVAAGGYWFLQGGGASGEGLRRGQRRPALQVAGNRIPQPAAACEEAEGWNLRAAGLAFELSGNAHTGQAALAAFRPPDDEGATAALPDFAVARSSEPVQVLPGDAWTAVAHLRTGAGGQAMLRLRFSASVEDYPFVFHPGTAAATYDDYTRVEVHGAVPRGADRAQVEIVALLPQPDSAVFVDDVALLPGGDGKAHTLQVAATGQTLIGTGASVAVESTDPGQPALLLALRPHVTEGPFLGLHRAGLTGLSDTGAELQVEVGETGFRLVAKGAGGVDLDFPPESGGGLLVRAEGEEFASVAAEGRLTARDVLLGSGLLRCMVALPAPGEVIGKALADAYRLGLPGAETFDLHLNFRAERNAAAEKLRLAEQALGQGRPGEALDRIRELQHLLPHDTEHLRASQELRGEILAELGRRVQDIRADLERAEFFDTRGGFVRVVQAVDELIERYGEHNIEEIDSLRDYRQQAAERILALDEQRTKDHRARLLRLAEIFAKNNEEKLAELIRENLKQ